MDYYYTPPDCISAGELVIVGEELVHLTHVMRNKPGDTVRVVDGRGTAYDATIIAATRHEARCMITNIHHRLHEPAVDVTVGVALLKNASKFDFLVEKVTELGVNAIVPLHTFRTIPRHARIDRWQKLALAAMKQSGRCVLPLVAEPVAFDVFLAAAPQSALRLIPHEKATLSLGNIRREHQTSTIIVCIGPEGGFSDEEIALATLQEFHPISLGARRLRTETAAMVAVAFAMQETPAVTS